jgi:hypothetical protein
MRTKGLRFSDYLFCRLLFRKTLKYATILPFCTRSLLWNRIDMRDAFDLFILPFSYFFLQFSNLSFFLKLEFLLILNELIEGSALFGRTVYFWLECIIYIRVGFWRDETSFESVSHWLLTENATVSVFTQDSADRRRGEKTFIHWVSLQNNLIINKYISIILSYRIWHFALIILLPYSRIIQNINYKYFWEKKKKNLKHQL